jgi:uncharacterized protein YjiK
MSMLKIIVVLTIASFLAAVGYVRLNHLDVLWWYDWKLNRQVMSDQALALGRYRVDIEARQVEGINDDLSALTYNPDTGTLFALLNGEPLLLELSVEGEVLRRIPVKGVRDMEGLTHVAGNQYVIAKERDQRLSLVTITEATRELDVSAAPSLVIALDEPGNKGFEGLSWDQANRRLLVVRERDPLRVLSVSGFVDAEAGEPRSLDITEIKSDGSARLFMSDLSSVSVDRSSGHIMLLSDESHMVVEYDAEQNPVSLLGLWRGMSGLRKTVPQAEGLAVDDLDRVYVVSEPNLFYRFVPAD